MNNNTENYAICVMPFTTERRWNEIKKIIQIGKLVNKLTKTMKTCIRGQLMNYNVLYLLISQSNMERNESIIFTSEQIHFSDRMLPQKYFLTTSNKSNNIFYWTTSCIQDINVDKKMF